jgi:hypothetical protein
LDLWTVHQPHPDNAAGKRTIANLATKAAPPSGPAPQQKEETQLEVTLATVEQGGDGKLVLTTTEGAVWRQVEHITIFPPPQRGQTLTILKNSFGGFLCKPSKWVTFRCYRTH